MNKVVARGVIAKIWICSYLIISISLLSCRRLVSVPALGKRISVFFFKKMLNIFLLILIYSKWHVCFGESIREHYKKRKNKPQFHSRIANKISSGAKLGKIFQIVIRCLNFNTKLMCLKPYPKFLLAKM
jgi:hypothetical protein